MGSLIDSAAAKAARWPDLVLAGHVHNYQRFSRQVMVASNMKTIPYIVIGNGGYHNLHGMAPDVGPLPWQAMTGVTLDAFDSKHWGYLRLEVSAGKIIGDYMQVSKDGTVEHFDSF